MKYKRGKEICLAVRLFHIQQLFLAPDAATVTRKVVVTANYAVAGNYDGYLVHSVCLRNCSYGIGPTDIVGLLFIASWRRFFIEVFHGIAYPAGTITLYNSFPDSAEKLHVLFFGFPG